MNILFAYITPFHPNKGGIGRVTHSLTIELLKRGHRVFYVIYKCGITVCHEFDYPAPLYYLPSSELLDPSNIHEYHKILSENDIDIVINQSGNFSDSELWLNTGDSKAKVISTIHTPPLVNPYFKFREITQLRNNSFKEKLKRIARVILYPRIKNQGLASRKHHWEWLLEQQTVACTLSKNFWNQIERVAPGNLRKCYAIPNPNSYSSEVYEKNIKKKKQILWVGLFTGEKRVIDAIRIWKRIWKKHLDWELIIIGYNKYTDFENVLKRKSRGIKSIKFEGYQNPEKYQEEASIAILTSLYEGWGMVLTEAMQYGTVPVAFDTSEVFSDIISDGEDGYLVKPFDYNEFANRLEMLMENPELLSKMSANAKESVKRFDIEKVADLWEELFEKLKYIIP